MASIRPFLDASSRRPDERARAGGAARSARSVAPLVAAAASVMMVGALAQACSFDWGAYDPRLASSSATGSGGAGSGGAGSGGEPTGGVGGMSASGAGGAGGSGSGSGGGGSGPSPCGGISLLSDNFEDGVQGIQWHWYAETGTTISEVGGEGVIVLPATSVSALNAAFQSKRIYDLRNDAISVEVKQVTNPATTASTFFTVKRNNSNFIEFVKRGTQLSCSSKLNGNPLTHLSIPYDSAIHRFWRLREDGTSVYWETSKDGSNWSTLTKKDTSSLFPVSSMRLEMGTYMGGAEVDSGEAHFDNVNGGGAPVGTWCPAATLKDNFDDGVVGPEWDRSYNGTSCTCMEEGGVLVAKPAMEGLDYCSYVASSSYNLIGSSLAIAVPGMASTSTTVETFVKMDAPGEGSVEIRQSEGTLSFRREVKGMITVLGSLAYKPSEHVWWRLREQGGTTYYEYSSDGKAWTIGVQDAAELPWLAALDVGIGVGTFETVIAPGETHFDNLNMPP